MDKSVDLSECQERPRCAFGAANMTEASDVRTFESEPMYEPLTCHPALPN
jgi:hypothetical protein